MARGKKKTTKSRRSSAATTHGNAELEALVESYRAFKTQNPARAARVPEQFKSIAQKIYQAGMPYSRIAEALGISPGAIKAWLGESAGRRSKTTDKREPARRIQGATSGLKQGWVKIRVEGREVEVSKNDFWDLLKGGLEAR